MRKVGEVGIIDGSKSDILEFEVWIWRNDKPEEITLRVVPDCYGGIPGRYEVRKDGSLEWKIPQTYNTKIQLLNAKINELEQNNFNLENRLNENREMLKLIDGMFNE